MPNTVPAAGEAMPKIDPLISEIMAYRRGVDEMNALNIDGITDEAEGEIVAQTYGAPLKRLLSWDQPAMTREGAIEALRFMGDEDVFVDDLGEPLRKAVLGYLETMPSDKVVNRLMLDMTGIADNGWLALDGALTNMADTLFHVMGRPQCGDDDDLNAAGRYIEALYNFMIEEHDRMRAHLRLSVDEGREDPQVPNRILLKFSIDMFDRGGFAGISDLAAKMQAEQQAFNVRRASK